MKNSLLISGLTVLMMVSSFAADLPPTFPNVSYQDNERNVLDFWRAEGDGPRPLLVYIHGGGWTTGDKDAASWVRPDFQAFLDRGISCAAINYRLAPLHPLPTPVHDAARAIQFLRSKAEAWGIQKDRIVLTGGSAGACTSLWIACHDDLADPDAEDPVKRESSRVRGAVGLSGQTSIDPPVIKAWLGPKVLEHRMIPMAVGLTAMEEVMSDYAKYEALYREFSPINHVSEDDPPLFLFYPADLTLPSKDAGHGIHHALFGIKMKEACDLAGQECHLVIKGEEADAEPYKTPEDFLFDILLDD